MSQDVILLAFVSDVHAGGATALCPPQIALDDGGTYLASKAQRWLWQCWEDYWARVAEVRKKENAELFVVLGGDLVEGNHHGTTQIVSGNSASQAQVVNACMRTVLEQHPDYLVVVRGTEAHVGKSGEAEEKIADGLHRDKQPIIVNTETDTASWWHFRAELHGKLIDITHHGRTGQREHTRAGAASLHAHDIFLSYTKRGERAPDLALRGHYHRFNDSYDAAPTRVVTSGAFQLATSHVKKVAPDTMADIGGVIVLLRPDTPIELEKVQFFPDRGPIWRPESVSPKEKSSPLSVKPFGAAPTRKPRGRRR